jgi:nucleotide-binding universal stress UspA family protein
MAVARFVVGVDGSDGAHAAVRWCAHYARALDADVSAVAVIEPNIPLVPPPGAHADAMQAAEDAEREKVRTTLEADWCQPLRDAASVTTGAQSSAIQRAC